MKKYFRLGVPPEVMEEMRKKLRHLHLSPDTPDEMIVDKFLEEVFFHKVKGDERISVEPLNGD